MPTTEFSFRLSLDRPLLSAPKLSLTCKRVEDLHGVGDPLVGVAPADYELAQDGDPGGRGPAETHARTGAPGPAGQAELVAGGDRARPAPAPAHHQHRLYEGGNVLKNTKLQKLKILQISEPGIAGLAAASSP